MIYTDIGKIIKKNNNFIITAHVSPDGDSIGSTLGLYNLLMETGKNASVILNDNPPEKYSYLPYFDDIIVYNDNINLSNMIDNCEGLFVLDSGDLERTGEIGKFIKGKNKIINIDHHISNTIFGGINIVDSNASSVGEMIYELIKINGFNISKNIAACLYTSIVTDTGGFKYSNTSSITFSIAGDLINTGIDFPDITTKALDRKTITQVKLMSYVASTIEMYCDNKLSVIALTRNMMNKLNAKDEDSEDFVNIARDIDTVEVAVFIKEKQDGTCRVSLRSKQYVDVRNIAQFFGGGGHIRAAGCTISGSIQEVKNKLINDIRKHL